MSLPVEIEAFLEEGDPEAPSPIDSERLHNHYASADQTSQWFDIRY